jgi:hypothetical protein
LLLIAAVAFVATGVWLAGLLGPSLQPGREFIGWVGIAFFGAGAAAIIARLFDCDDQIIIDDRGIYWKRWSDHTIPWVEVKDVREARVRSTRFLCLDLKHPDRFPSRKPRRRLAAFNRRLGYGDISLSALGTDKRLDELKSAVLAYWTRSLRG